MMRSLYSGVAGLRAHQTRMDVLGNNIANVNTVGFKASGVNFSDMFYQTTSPATGPNAATGAAGTNAKQIGLGSLVASITTNITEQGGTQSTNRALDLAINGDAFFIVKSGGMTYFQKAGALNVDAFGNLYSTTNGATIQGWLADDDGNIVKDLARDLTVMSAENTYYEPESTENVTLKGNIDKMDPDVHPDTFQNADTALATGEPITFSFYDNLGQLYTAKLYIYANEDADTTTNTEYIVTLGDVLDENGDSIFLTSTTDENGTVTYAARPTTVQLGGAEFKVDPGNVTAETGEFILSSTGTLPKVRFNTKSGEFVLTDNNGFDSSKNSIYKDKGVVFSIDPGNADGAIDDTFTPFNDETQTGGVIIDFSALTQYSNSGVSNVTYTKGDVNGLGTGNMAGEMKGISIDENGYIYGTYNNGMMKLLAQIAVATFNNPSGLEAVGDSLFQATQNSGDFDGVGEDISLSGSFAVGALEMSNVDLANEFVNMITTQRGFQANSRIITTSDSMLEEIVNLKR